MSTNSQNRRTSGLRLPLWGLILLIALTAVVGFGILGGTGLWLYRTIETAVAESNIQQQSPTFANNPNTATNNSATTNNNAPSTTNSDTTDAVPLTADIPTWQGRDRVTILLMGVDTRCEETGPDRTDSLMLVTVDPVGKTAGILSLPRDLWVEIPGFGVDRINKAHFLGEAYEYPGGGPALALETVATTLGIDIDYYVTVNFDAFKEIVNLLGGLDIDVPEAIDDENYPDNCYGYDPFQIEAGAQTLDGEQALKYARTRATDGGDVDRAGRQQTVVLAAREKILRQFPSLILQAPALWQTLDTNVRTTLTLDEALQLAMLVQEIPDENIRQAVIDYNYVYPEYTPQGDAVLVPIRENIRALRDELFTPPAVPTAVIQDLPEKVQAENARVALYNGTAVYGLAGTTKDYLLLQNVNVTEVGNAESATYPSTQIVDFGDHPNTVQYLVRLMNVPPLNVSQGDKPDGDYDILVIIGNDWELPNN
ncbi:MAG: LCP family protein [Anaerolineales bacterium]|nr:LCP family protein [Anaerolineales bacterium]